MGGTNSCFPSPIEKLTAFRRQRYEPKKCYERTTRVDLNNNQNLDLNRKRKIININTATEKDLLEIPGITQALAHRIVLYRDDNENFKRFEQLLQIDGIDQQLLEQIKSHISIDLPSSISTEIRPIPINLNSADSDQLLEVPGLTPILIERIVQRRQRKGPFRFIEDLLNIKGIDYVVLAQLRPHVTIEDRSIPRSASESSIFQSAITNAIYPSLRRSSQHLNSDSLSLASMVLETLPPELKTIFLSPTLPLPSSPQLPVHNEKLFRFASWNLQQLTIEKVQNPGVKEVICRIILENKLSLIGIQEIGHKDALGFIIQELNCPTIPSIRDRSPKGQRKWNYIVSDIAGRMFQGCEYLGFIYDENAGVQFKRSSLLPFKTYFTRSPFIGVFGIHEKYDLVFVNIHLKARRLDENENERTKDEASSLSILAEAMDDTVDQKHIIIFGDFNLSPTASAFDALLERNYSYIIQDNTNISLKTPQGSTCIDNFWISNPLKQLMTKNAGVIRENLTNMWIPAGWTWGGLVSDHCPIWIELDFST